MKRILVLASLTLVCFVSQAQEEPCAFDEHLNYLTERFPEQGQRFWESYHNEALMRNAQRTSIPADSILRIPTVVHVFHDGGIENISDAQVLDMMRVMNEDFRRTHADTALTDSHFVDVVTDMQIEFILAKLDPDSNCTNGIVRHRSRLAANLPQGFKQFGWDNRDYLNIYLVGGLPSSPGSILIGFAMPPGFNTPLRVDGIMNRSDHAGSIGTALNSVTGAQGGSIVSHEAGHYVGLMHTFQDGCFGFGDNCDDTPPVNVANQGACGTSPINSCSNDLPDLPDMVENYMDYSNNFCLHSFTKDQKTRAFDRLLDVFGRRRLLEWDNLKETGILLDESPCAPMPDFMIQREVIPLGASTKLYGNAYNGTVTTRMWDFPGAATITGANDSIAQVWYESPGIYDFTYTVGNSLGTNSKTYEGRIVVLDTTIQNPNGPVIVDFDQANSSQSLLFLASELGNSFAVTSDASLSGSSSLKLDNWSKTSQAFNREYQVDQVFFGPYDPSVLTSYNLTFDYAMAAARNNTNDNIRVSYSKDGLNWTARGSISATDMITDSVMYETQPYIPASTSVWNTKSIPFSVVQNETKIWFRIEYISEYGNNFYLDNLYFGTAVGQESIEPLEISVYPNPANEFITVSTGTEDLNRAELRLTDLTGRLVFTQDLGQVAANSPIRVDLPYGLAAGSYLLRIESSEGSFSKPWVIQ